ncbi:MAG: LPO_1073/Vpar_1526 family protein [Candidatus Thiodiazotropha endolucinida]
MNKQNQKGGDNSENLQAAGNITKNYYIGASKDEVKQIALQVFETNFYKLTNEAHSIAFQRAEEITNKIIHRLWQKLPSGFNAASDPDFQYILYSAQRDFARTGDRNIGDLLVDLIIERCKSPDRSIRQIICDEALEILPKISQEMINILGIVFFFRHYYGETTIDKSSISRYPNIEETSLSKHLNKYVMPFGIPIYAGYYLYKHLETTSCCTFTEQREKSLVEIIKGRLQGYFQAGFTQDEIDETGLSKDMQKRLIIPCLNDTNKLQVNAVSLIQLSLKKSELNLTKEDKSAIDFLFENRTLYDSDIMTKCANSAPYMKNIFELWSQTELGKVNLTSNGIAIGHASLKKHVEDIPDLEYWIR